MFGKGKKTVSLEYKNKLLAEIDYYEKRISEMLQRNSSKSLGSFDDVESSDEDDGNPYTLNINPSISELKKQEASLESRVSMTLELAMLTIMHSDNANIMTEPPVVRTPVNEDGTWLEVTADCKIDLVSFVITFYAHKPYRKLAPTRYRNVEVKLTKPAHEKELTPSILSKLNRPNLALQVLQSYASAFRSRRTTLLELAHMYADKLRMEEMAEGGYRVKFLDLLTVDWSLENMWSPVVPFCHRMKFEVEYMPEQYIQTISKLYKKFRDPTLETPQRTTALRDIFDTCLKARAAGDLQTAESDPEPAGRLQERRTTIDQEPEIPSSYHSPKKPTGKENKAQNRKTAMEPPRTVPKKVKKTRPNIEVGEEINAKKSKPNVTEDTSDSRIAKKVNDKNVSSESRMDDAKKNKTNDKEQTVESRKGLKRAVENGTHSNPKKIRSENDSESNSKSSGDKASEKATKDISDTQNIKNKGTSSQYNKGDTNKKGNLKSASTNSLTNKVVDGKEITANSTKTKGANSKDNAKGNIENAKATKKSVKDVANSKVVEGNAGLKKTSNKKDNTESNNASDSVKNNAEINKEAKSSNNVKNKIQGKEVNPKTKTGDVNAKVVAKSKNVLKENVEKNVNKVVTRKSNIIDKAADNENKVQESNIEKVVTKKGNDAKTPANSKNENVKENISKNVKQTKTNDGKEKDPRKVTNAVKSDVNAVKKIDNKQATKPKESNDPAKKKVDDKTSNTNTEVPKQNVDETKKSKNNDGTITKTIDKTFTKMNVANKDQLNKEPAQNAVKNTLKAKSTGLKTNKNPDVKLSNSKENAKTNNMKEFFTKKQTTKAVSDSNVKNDKHSKTEDNGPKINKEKENNKITSKETKTNHKERNDEAKTSSNTNKNTITNTDKGAFKKFTENQSRVAAQLKTKIPMIKSKIRISKLTNKLEQNAITKIAVDKTKIPLKSLPVFKKINIPTRMSPRKPPTSFKPPKGVSSKLV